MIDDLQVIKRRIERMLENALDLELKAEAQRELSRILAEIEAIIESEEIQERDRAMQAYRDLLDAYDRGEYDRYFDDDNEDE